jgi:hypothetical protein
MFLVDIHEFDVILAAAVALRVFEDQVQGVWGVGSLEGQDILILSSAQDLSERVQVDSKSNVTVASVW